MMKITNISKSKLVFAAGFALTAGQSRKATEEDLKTFNPVLIELWKKNGLIEVEGEAPAAKPEPSDADKAKAEAEAKAKAGGGKGKLPG